MKNKLLIGIGIIIVILLSVSCYILGTKSVESTSLFVEDGMIKYKSNAGYEELLSLEDLLAEEETSAVVNDKKIEFSVQDGYIVWNYVGETNTNKLIAIEELVGKQGEKGADGINGVDGKDGTNGVDGTNGTNGKDGQNGIITEMAVIQGTKGVSDIFNEHYIYLTETTESNFYSTGQNISLTNDGVNLKKGKYLITVTGNCKFTSGSKIGITFKLHASYVYFNSAYDMPYLNVSKVVDVDDEYSGRLILTLIVWDFDTVDYTITISKIG